MQACLLGVVSIDDLPCQEHHACAMKVSRSLSVTVTVRTKRSVQLFQNNNNSSVLVQTYHAPSLPSIPSYSNALSSPIFSCNHLAGTTLSLLFSYNGLLKRRQRRHATAHTRNCRLPPAGAMHCMQPRPLPLLGFAMQWRMLPRPKGSQRSLADGARHDVLGAPQQRPPVPDSIPRARGDAAGCTFKAGALPPVPLTRSIPRRSSGQHKRTARGAAAAGAGAPASPAAATVALATAATVTQAAAPAAVPPAAAAQV